MEAVFNQGIPETVQGTTRKVLNYLLEVFKESTTDLLFIKKRDIAETLQCTEKTVSRQLEDLKRQDYISFKGLRGRLGGLVVAFDTDKLTFPVNKKAGAASEDSKDVLLEKHLENIKKKKKQEEDKKFSNPKRKRRTKRELEEEKRKNLLNKDKVNTLNEVLKDNNYIVSWDIFLKTENPIQNYKAYLISRLYNQYAFLFPEEYNEDQKNYSDSIPTVTSNYDCLPVEFFGTTRFNQFYELSKELDDNEFCPAVYLSAQFTEVVNLHENKHKKYHLPLINTFVAFKNYHEYVKRNQKNRIYFMDEIKRRNVPARFLNDFMVRQLVRAYRLAEEDSTGMLPIKHTYRSFIEATGTSEDYDALSVFFQMTDHKMRKNNISLKSRDLIKKHLFLQSVSQMDGLATLPEIYVFSNPVIWRNVEMIKHRNSSLIRQHGREEGLYMIQQKQAEYLSSVLYPAKREEAQEYYHIDSTLIAMSLGNLDESEKVVSLIASRKRLNFTEEELSEAYTEYGMDKVPFKEDSSLDFEAIRDKVSDLLPPLMVNAPIHKIPREHRFDFYKDTGSQNFTAWMEEERKFNIGG